MASIQNELCHFCGAALHLESLRFRKNERMFDEKSILDAEPREASSWPICIGRDAGLSEQAVVRAARLSGYLWQPP
jgi:hypothetical protein